MENVIIVIGFLFSVILLRVVSAALFEMISPQAEIRAARRRAEAASKRRAFMRKIGCSGKSEPPVPYSADEESPARDNIMKTEIRNSEPFPAKKGVMIHSTLLK